MKKWSFLILLMLPMGYWALYEKEEKSYEIDGVRLPWSIQDIKTAYKFDLSNTNEKISFVVHPTGYWWILSPEKGMANQAKLSSWLNLLMMPKIMRWMTPNTFQREKLKRAMTVEFDCAEGKKFKFSYYEPEEREKYAYLYLPAKDKIFVLEKNISLDSGLNAANYRALNIFPFAKTAVASMTYSIKGVSYVFKKHEKGWEINFPMTKTWGDLIKNMYNTSCMGFIEGKRKADVLASWEFAFESGAKSLAELFLVEEGYVVYYRGRDIGLLIGTNELVQNFPGVVSDIQ